MQRKLFSEEHDIFRDQVKKWVEKEIIPYNEQCEKDGIVPREWYLKAGEQGFCCPMVAEKYGGLGVDFLYSVVLNEELVKSGNTGFALGLHNDVVAPYIETFATEEKKKEWLPKCISGERILAVAMTEPNAGSDLAAIKTTAVDKGDHYLVNGQKTFITNGILADIVIVAVVTNPDAKPKHSGISLLVVEREMEGFTRGQKFEKMGMHGQDTAEMFFDDVKVPKENLLGKEGMGFIMLMQKLQQERLVCAIGAQAGAESVFEISLKYAQERHAFGKPIAKHQVNRFKLAEMKTEVELGRVFVDRLIEEHMAGKNIVSETCMAKWWVTEMLKRAADTGVQLHGGYGYMMEYQICKAFLDARVQTIFAGSTEIMKEVVGRSIGC